MAIGKDFSELLFKIGYSFSDQSYLENALTHASYSNEYRSKGLNLPSNERLEFLGDAVLQIVISEYLYDNFKEFNEGNLTVMRQKLVCERTLAKVAESISLGDYIHLGRGEEGDCRKRPKILANTLEALIGAIFLDCRERNSEEYKEVISSLIKYEFSSAVCFTKHDYKTLLQKLVEKDGSAVLEYRVIDESGPDHKKSYTVVAMVNNNEVGKGVAAKKRDAEMAAAKMALELFGYKDV